MNKLFYSVSFLLLLLSFSILLSGCAKEYSYEYKPADSLSINNTIAPVVSSCSSCKEASFPESSWRLTINGIVYCGKADKTIVLPERTLFTFFGASACSADSGFVASVYLENDVLSADKANIKASMTCYYYDNIASSHVYMSILGQPLQLIIISYKHQSGITTGTFKGKIADTYGNVREVKDGRFHIKL